MNNEFRHSGGFEFGMAFKESFLQAIFDFVFDMIQVLIPVRDETGLITNFKIMLLDAGLKDFSESPRFEKELYLEEFPEARGSGLFDKLVNVAEKKNILDEIFNYHESGRNESFRFTLKELDGGMILFRENVTESVTAKE